MQQHNTSPPLEDTSASLTTLTCLCHPLTTPTPATPPTTPLTTPVPTPVPSQPHATMTPVPRSPPLTCQCHLSPPQHTGAPLHLQHHSRHHLATPIKYCTACEMKTEGNMWMKKIVDPSNPPSLIYPNQCNGTQLYSSIRARLFLPLVESGISQRSFWGLVVKVVFVVAHKPLDDKVSIKVEEAEENTKGGIFLPQLLKRSLKGMR
ncbi:GroES chaperonin family [Vigna unguiculata]|uniref:GroES chaperonin family n=1 Tax=Vigna unguiculata TaxID=3917 RepID=A0A4D6L5J0_VIGUN|nr:GroES chaperonin family [Vigna unguiculata]